MGGLVGLARSAPATRAGTGAESNPLSATYRALRTRDDRSALQSPPSLPGRPVPACVSSGRDGSRKRITRPFTTQTSGCVPAGRGAVLRTRISRGGLATALLPRTLLRFIFPAP